MDSQTIDELVASLRREIREVADQMNESELGRQFETTTNEEEAKLLRAEAMLIFEKRVRELTAKYLAATTGGGNA
jgi:hypothetical protein